MLRVSPRQRSRLIQIIHNLNDRISEARMNGWLGEAQGLQVSLTKAKEKLTSLDRSIGRVHSPGDPIHLGTPIISSRAATERAAGSASSNLSTDGS